MMMESLALDEKKSLYEKLCKPEILLEAWQKVRNKNAQGGIDRVNYGESAPTRWKESFM